MALFKISKGASGGLNNQALGDGYCWFTYDDGKFYIDYKDPSDNIVKRKALNADKADKDANGNIITSTYLPLTGGIISGNLSLTGELNVTGNTYLHNQTTIDSLTAGSLIVNGNSSFINDVSFIKSPLAPTPASGDNSTKLATTEFVKNSIAGLSGAMHFRGTTTTTMSDGLTTAAVTINESSYNPSAGDVVLYNDGEYVWTGSAWELLGDAGSFKVRQTAAVSSPSVDEEVTATAFIDTISQNINGDITATKKALDTSGTWSGNAGAIKYQDISNNNTDLNTLHGDDYAVYYAGGGNNALNAPPGVSSFGLTVKRVAIGYRLQDLIASGGSRYTRIWNGSTWTDWSRLPSGTGSGASGTWGISITGNADTATKLSTARKLKVALNSTADVTFDGSADQLSIPISGILDVTHGGTSKASWTQWGIVYASTSTALAQVAAGTDSDYANKYQYLMSNGAAAPIWSTALTLNNNVPAIASNGSLDNLKTPGVYSVENAATGQTITGYPNGINAVSGSKVIVFGGYPHYGHQFVLGSDIGRIFHRVQNSNSGDDWNSTWYRLVHAPSEEIKVGDTNKGVYLTASGILASTSYTVDTSVPSNAVFTDTKVTAVDNHYEPAEDENAALSASASGASADWSIDVVKAVQLQRDAKGHVTGVTVTSGKIPANPNTDYNVRQTDDASTNANYRLLLSNSANDTQEDSISRKNANLIYNPSTNKLSTGNLQLTGELDVIGNVYLHNQTMIDSLTAGSLIVTGIISGQLNHKITIGNYEYDGSSDITIPIYNGATS